MIDYMIDLSGNMINIVDISDLLSQFNTVDLRDNPCCYTLYPVWSGCIITGSNNNSISTMLVLFITNTLLIVASCFPYIVEYVGVINAYYVRVVRWATLIRRIQRQARIHPARLFRRAPEAEALQRREQNERAVPEQIPAAQPIEAQHEPEVVEVLQEPEVAEPGRRPQRRAAICARHRMRNMR